MILADKIIEERKRCGMSQEELAEKLSVSRQAVSKWESAQSTPDLQRVIVLAEIFGVSTDYLLKDEQERLPVIIEENGSDMPLPVVSMEQANDFLGFSEKGSRRVSMGTAMCIFSPCPLVFLMGLSEDGVFGITETAAAIVGLVSLFALIAAAVFMFIVYGVEEKRFAVITTESFETAYGVSGLVREKKKEYERSFILGLALGVVLCVVAVVPLIVAGVMEAKEYILTSLASLMLLLIALGVYMIVRVSMVRGGFDALLQEGEHTAKAKRAGKKLDPISSIYWCAVVAGYLAWSFYTDDWKTTWIVWPVAGVLFAVVENICRIFMEKE